MSKVTPFLMFQGNAEEAIQFYTSVIDGSEINEITRYDEDGPMKQGTVMKALFTIKDQQFMCIDSATPHDFTFTPSFSIFVECDSEDEIDYLYEKLGTGGAALMPINDYGFSQKFGWLVDQFGVSWQLNLA